MRTSDMTLQHRDPRPGVTLVEVLVAIFIMGIGLICLLTLFPLGIVNMAQAIKDDRTAYAGHTAINLARTFQLYKDDSVWAIQNATNAAPPQNWYLNPYPKLPKQFPSQYGMGLAGYPVYLDPIGNGGSATLANQANGIPRIGKFTASPQSSLTSSSLTAARWFSTRDDLDFSTDAVPIQTGVGLIQPPAKYSWAYLSKPTYCSQSPPAGSFPQATTPVPSNLTSFDVTVVVYANRSLFAGNNTENAYKASISVSTNQIAVSYAGTKPNIRKGGWVMDGTMEPGGGYFYRVVSVDDFTTKNQLMIETLTPPVVGSSSFPKTFDRTLIVLDNVVEVFPKGIQPQSDYN
jgi:prepilin-type N-terminal cleavage/methylation domain-containing protein